MSIQSVGKDDGTGLNSEKKGPTSRRKKNWFDEVVGGGPGGRLRQEGIGILFPEESVLGKDVGRHTS